MSETLSLVVLFFCVALLYASVGHGGASGYLAVMALLSVEPALIRPTALILNVFVASFGTYAFFRQGHFSARLFWPFAISAVPFAYLGGSLSLPDEVFRKILGFALCVALFRLFMPVADSADLRRAPLWAVVLLGMLMGFCSGLIGVGGGIFLTPLVILMGWARAKTAAAISAPFILVNSLAGLAGLQMQSYSVVFHPLLPYLVVVVLLAGWIGASWGSMIAKQAHIRYALGGVLSFAAFKLFL